LPQQRATSTCGTVPHLREWDPCAKLCRKTRSSVGVGRGVGGWERAPCDLPGVDEEEEAELARVGARHSLPTPEPRRTGADETCPPVCMMKSSCTPLSYHPRAPLPLVLPFAASQTTRNTSDLALRCVARTARCAGRAAASPLSAGGSHACFLRHLSHHPRTQPDPRSSGRFKAGILRDGCPVVPLILQNTPPRPQSLSTCLLCIVRRFSQIEQEIATR
jgi:hypothetical protein